MCLASEDANPIMGQGSKPHPGRPVLTWLNGGTLIGLKTLVGNKFNSGHCLSLLEGVLTYQLKGR